MHVHVYMYWVYRGTGGEREGLDIRPLDVAWRSCVGLRKRGRMGRGVWIERREEGEFSIIEKGETGGRESGSVEAAALECGKSEKLSKNVAKFGGGNAVRVY
jgi:hypothetical protein